VSNSRHITVIQKYFAVLSLVVGSNLFASFAIAQAHDHGAMPATAPVAAEDHSQHAATADSHAGHVMETNAPAYDPHAGHVMETADNAANEDHSQHTPTPDPHAGHVMETTDNAGSADHSQHTPTLDPHAGHVMDTSAQAAKAGDVAAEAHNHGEMAMDMSSSESSQSRRRDPHAYSDGLKVGEGPYALDNYRLHLMDEMNFSAFRMNRMEQLFIDGVDATAYDAQAWYGTGYNRLVMKAEGEVQDGSLEESNTELLWTHGISSFWNTQIGMLHQTGVGSDRNWLALGIQGLAPYWFEVDATFYVGEGGRSAFNMEAEYDLLLTQRAIIQPRIEMNLYGQNDQAAAIGSGLSDFSAGIRLQYQINRQLVPYAGVEQVRLYGQTAQFSGVSSGDSETRWLVGLRFWF
jgi:copper resistance protein B